MLIHGGPAWSVDLDFPVVVATVEVVAPDPVIVFYLS